MFRTCGIYHLPEGSHASCKSRPKALALSFFYGGAWSKSPKKVRNASNKCRDLILHSCGSGSNLSSKDEKSPQSRSS